MSTGTHTLRRGRLRWCVVLGALSIACLAAIPARGGPASAELSQAGLLTFDAGRFHDIGGPRFAGESVVWAEPDARNGGYRLVTGLADGSTRELTRVEGPGRGLGFGTFVAASSTQVLVDQAFQETAPLNPERPEDGTFRLVGGNLEQVGPGGRVRNLDVSGDAAIFPADHLDVTIRDFGPSPTPTRTVRAEGPVSIAGRYAAWAQGADIVVYDWRAGAEAYRIRGVVSPPNLVESVGVQEDGKVAFGYAVTVAERASHRVGWASPAEPFVHPLALPDDAPYHVRLVGDGVAYLRRSNFEGARGELGVAGLSGGAQTLVRPVESAGDQFDFDGTRLVWQTRTCDSPKVSVASLDELAARPRLGRLPRCALVIRNRPRVTRSGHVVFRFDCTGLAVGCFYQALRVRTARRERLGGRRIRKGRSIAFRFGPGATVARARLNRVGRRLARKRGPLRVLVKADRLDNTFQQRRQAKIPLR